MMKKTFTPRLWGFLLFMLFAVTACEQDDKVIETVGINDKEAFFSTEAKLSNYEKALLEGAKKWVTDSIVNKWIEVYGNPEWEKSQLISSENDISILFTTLKNRQEARGLLAIICKNNKIRTQVFSRNFITNSKKGMPLFALFVQMNPSEFPNYTIKEQKTPVQTRSVIFITRCWEVWSGTEGNMKYRYTNCSTQMISMMMHWNSGMDHIGGGGGVGPGGGGGGGISPNPTPEVDDNKVPCEGDPVPKPEVAPSNGWNLKGGTYGWTRSNGKRFHDGIDIKANVNSRLYSMHKGKVIEIRNTFTPGEYKDRSYGNYIEIVSTINGETISLRYNHLNKVDVKVGDVISQGDYIGLTGNTGNAQSTEKIKVIPHVHIIGRKIKDGKKIKVNPAIYLGTKFDKNGKVISRPCK